MKTKMYKRKIWHFYIRNHIEQTMLSKIFIKNYVFQTSQTRRDRMMAKLSIEYAVVLICCLMIMSYAAVNKDHQSTFYHQNSMKSDITFGQQFVQPCSPYDSCFRRCVNGISTTDINITLGYFNCFCDEDCEIFGDCCWDYRKECNQQKESSVSVELEEDLFKSTARDNIALHARDESFECVVVDEFSKGSYWMINRCHANWTHEDIKKKCIETDSFDFTSYLPVIGKNGWTYRNAFCAQCNHVTDFFYWVVKATCTRSAPPEVLKGDSVMLSYYLQNFCTAEVQQDVTHENVLFNRDHIFNGNIRELITRKKSLRSCEKNIIDTCPDGYTDTRISALCKIYQSIVLAEDVFEPTKKLIFKNPMCALCHGYSVLELQHHNQPKLKENETRKQGLVYSNIACPVWILKEYYDKAFWSLDLSLQTAAILPSFNKNYKTSNWAPPSFSVLMRFRENGESEITYQDSSSSSITISTQQTCDQSEIYDPFYGTCRLVICANDMIFTPTGCISDPSINSTYEIASATLPTLETSAPSFVTVTISISIPYVKNQQTNNQTESNEVYIDVITAFESVFNATAENVTVSVNDNKLTTNFSNENSSNVRDRNEDGILVITTSFVILPPGNYTDEDLMQIVEQAFASVEFDEIRMKVDSVYLVIIEKKSPPFPFSCSEETEQIRYESNEYELQNDNEGNVVLYINATNSYYSENHYQWLHRNITFSKNDVEYANKKQSRVVACQQNSSETLAPCNIYVPLNESEYEIFDNESLWLKERYKIVPKDQYIEYQGGFAVCVDSYMTTDTDQIMTSAENSVHLVISWVTFGLTIFSLACLLFTFLTYCLFSDLRSIAGWNIMNLTVSLFLAHLIFLIGSTWTSSPDICTAFAMLLHYLYLSTFFWNNILAFDVWLTFGQGIKKTLRRSLLSSKSIVGQIKGIHGLVIKYMIYGWGMPLILVGICTAVEFGFPEVNVGYHYDPEVPICWISNPTTNVLAFGGPLIVILLANMIFFTISIVAIRKVTNQQRRRRMSSTASITSIKEKVTSPQKRKPSQGTQPTKVFTFSQPTKIKCTRKTFTSGDKRNSSSATQKFYKTSMGLARINVLLYVKMSTVMGFIWAIGLAAALVETTVLWYIFEISVPLQGVFILIAFICKRRILELYKRLFHSPLRKRTDSISGNMNNKTFKLTKKQMPNTTIQSENQRQTAAKNESRRKLPTGVEPIDLDQRGRSRTCSDGSCGSSNSQDRWIQPSPAFVDCLSTVAKTKCGVINRSYMEDGGEVNQERHQT